MIDDLKTRLTNANSVLQEIYRQTDDEELKATCNNIRTPLHAILSELEFCCEPDSEQLGEEILIETMQRIKEVQEQISGADTMRSYQPPHTITKKP
jgi:hypothetical protein